MNSLKKKLENSTSKLIALVALTLVLSACGDKDEDFADRSVDELYNEAMNRFEKESYVKAAKAFAEVERQHPYSNWALKAQLMSAYSYYQARKYDEAIEAFNTFIQLHPGHSEVPYAYYMLGLCHYEQIPMIERDQQATEKALSAFQEVSERFPASDYAKDSKLKTDLIRDHLAGKEMDIGHFYQKNFSYLAALNRFKEVIQNYQTTSYAPEALHRMVECYLALGILDQAQATAAVLGHNYPSSMWYQDSYALIQVAVPKSLEPAVNK